MKFTFTNDEKAYINIRLRILIPMLKKAPWPSESEKTIIKMRDKFSPNANVTFLGQKERNLLLVIMQRLMNEHIRMNSVAPEMETIQNIIDKIQ